MLNPDRHEVSEVLNTRVEPVVRILNGSLDEVAAENGAAVLHGRIDNSTLRFLKVDKEYQRPLGERADIFAALKEGRIVPNIEIGVRGQDFDVDGNDVIIKSPSYIIDGWQRIGNAIRLLEMIPDAPVRIYASVHFGTDQVWERHRFTALNKNIKKVSPNLHLKNVRDSNAAVLTLYGLSNNDKSFSLYKKVCWEQTMQRGQLLSATTFAKSVMLLHAHHTAIRESTTELVSEALLSVSKRITLASFRKNVHSFYGVLDECWPFAAIGYRDSSAQIKSTFLYEIARMFSRHPSFWDETQAVFSVDADDRRKLAKFPIRDPQVVNLAGTAGKARAMLYQLLVDHMNSGRRTNRLRSRFDD